MGMEIAGGHPRGTGNQTCLPEKAAPRDSRAQRIALRYHKTPPLLSSIDPSPGSRLGEALLMRVAYGQAMTTRGAIRAGGSA